MRAVKIVLIEDNPADILLVELALKANAIPYEMTKFMNGREAVGVLCALEDPAEDAFSPDLILMDLNTPKSNGFEVLRELKHSPRLMDVPIAILTSSSAASDRLRSAMEGARFIQKPSAVNDFFAAIGQAVRDMLPGRELRPE